MPSPYETETARHSFNICIIPAMMTNSENVYASYGQKITWKSFQYE